MTDYDTLGGDDFVPLYKSNGDFPSMFTDLFKSINWKVAILLYMFSIFIFSDLFIELFLSSQHLSGDTPNDTGTMIQISSLVATYIIVDLLVQGRFI
jgi:hypothetical protein